MICQTFQSFHLNTFLIKSLKDDDDVEAGQKVLKRKRMSSKRSILLYGILNLYFNVVPRNTTTNSICIISIIGTYLSHSFLAKHLALERHSKSKRTGVKRKKTQYIKPQGRM